MNVCSLWKDHHVKMKIVTELMLFTITYIVDLLINERILLIDTPTDRRTSKSTSERDEPGPSSFRLQDIMSDESHTRHRARRTGHLRGNCTTDVRPGRPSVLTPETVSTPTLSPVCYGCCVTPSRNCDCWIVFDGPLDPRTCPLPRLHPSPCLCWRTPLPNSRDSPLLPDPLGYTIS